MFGSEKDLREFGALIGRLAMNRQRLSKKETFEAYRQIILNEQPELQQGAFLLAHIIRGPSSEEMLGALEAMNTYDLLQIHSRRPGQVCDIDGTGSASLKTVEYGASAALIAAACGLQVAKKGARSVTGTAAATETFERLGIDIEQAIALAEISLAECGFCFLPAEAYMKSSWRRLSGKMRFTSLFNLLGPLTRPCAESSCIVLGTYSPHVSNQLVDLLQINGFSSAICSYGMAEGIDIEMGVDGISPCGDSLVVELTPDGKVSSYELRPEDFGARPCRFEEIAASPDPDSNARRIFDILSGKKAESPEGRFFCINAAAMLKVSGIAPDFKVGYLMASQALASGAAFNKFVQFKSFQGLK